MAQVKKPVTPEVSMKILKTGKCKSLSGKSNLTYNIGVDPESAIQIRIKSNDGGGFFSIEWIDLDDVLALLKKHPKDTPITSTTLTKLYKGKSVNSPAFLVAALKNEGLLQSLGGKQRSHELVDPDAFTAKMNALTAAKPATKKAIKKRPSTPRKRKPASS